VPVGLQAFFNTTFNPANQTALVGWADFTAVNLPPTSGDVAELFFSFNVRVKEGAVPTVINLDSTFVPPAGSYVASIDTTIGPGNNVVAITPQYADCGSGDIFLPVHEYEWVNLPEKYALDQNSPNPFNPTTKIEFALPHSGDVTLDVFNVLGQKVTTLVDEHLNAGFKSVEWDGTDALGNEVSSGVYLYRINVNDFSATRKMLLLK
jgi:hypothetical protein